MSRLAILASALLLVTSTACCERSATEDPPVPQPTAAPYDAVIERIDALVRDAGFAEAEKIAVELPSEVVAAQAAATTGHTQLLYAGVHLRRAPWRLDVLEPILLHGEDGATVVRSLCPSPTSSHAAANPLTWVERPDPPFDVVDRVATTASVAETRCEALSCVAEWHLPRAAKLARRAHVFSETRACALRVLGRVGDEEDVPTMIEHLDSVDDRVRSAAIDGLGALPFETARQALRTFAVQAGKGGDSHMEESARRAWLGHPLRTNRPGMAGRLLPDRVTTVTQERPPYPPAHR